MVLPRIVWRKTRVEGDLDSPFIALDRPAPSPEILTDRMAVAIQNYGVPQVEDATNPKQDAIGLLMLAAEVEHALMAQYLYSAQSVRGIAGRTISRIAVQEMGHLITVNNLLLLLKGTNADNLPACIHLGRDALRRHSTHNPLPFVLEPVSHIALAKFVVIERPATIHDQNVLTRVEDLEAEVEALGADPNPVYALYAAIRWIFQESDEQFADLSAALGFKPGWHLLDTDFADPSVIDQFASKPVEWGSVPGLIVTPASDRVSALAAIDAITEQGEGSPGTADSHFSVFLGVLDSFESGQIEVAPLPRTPFVASQPIPEDSECTQIINPYTDLWGQLFNVFYELLLLDIAWGISRQRDEPARRQLIDVCIDSMNLMIQPISAHLAKRPLDDDPDITAGPPYGLNREDLPTTIADFLHRYNAIFTQRDALISEIGAAADFSSDIPGRIILSSVGRIDDQRAPFLPAAGG